ncbi:MAG: uracil-DNA glycosylase family protein [Pseudomonadales bacterium]|jgi:uracil-DNA glycosylase|nr:uracil-DNA glycosylase family protein [Pseudomonadales bacterium]
MSQFIQLVDEISRCTLCAEHLPLGPRPVIQADPAARILIVGQAPGTAVHKTGIPFNDPSGDRLRTWMGVDRDTFYDQKKIALVPMGFCYPGKGKGGDLPPRPECAPAWRERLLGQLDNIELTIVMGRYALAWHLNIRPSQTLNAVVANWQQYWPQALPLPHPSPRNSQWLQKHPWVEEDIIPKLQQRIRTLLNKGGAT